MTEVSSSEVFKMFRAGYSPMKVVEETGADPSKVTQWFRDWVNMREDWGWFTVADLKYEASLRLDELTGLLVEDATQLQGKDPKGLLAGMTYIIAKERGLNVSKRRLAEVYDVTETTVSVRVKFLENLIQEKGVKLHLTHEEQIGELEDAKKETSIKG